MNKIEIKIDDLKDNIKKEILKFYGIKDPKEMNLDIIPLFIIEK